jgi:hypothetical protein
MSPWKEAYAELENAIHDLPLWVNIARSVHHSNQLDDQDHLEAMTLALDELYDKAIKLRETYERIFEEASQGVTEVVNLATEQAAAERSR